VAGPVRPAMATAEPGDVIRIDLRGGSIRRTGRRVVPRQLKMRPSWCDVTLDFTEAVIMHDTLRIDMNVRGGSLTLLTGPGILVDADSLTVRYTRSTSPPAPDLVSRSFSACNWLAACATAGSRSGGCRGPSGQ